MNTITSRIIGWLIQSEIISEKDRVIYHYGFNQLIVLWINYLLIGLIGWIFNVFVEIVLLAIVYFSMRKYAGGFHARTQNRCYVYSNLLMILCGYILKYDFFNENFLLVSFLFSLFSLSLLVPVEDPNKPLDDEEEKLYRKKFFLILMMIVIGIGICWYMEIHLWHSMILAVLVMNIMVIIGFISNKIIEYSKRK